MAVLRVATEKPRRDRAQRGLMRFASGQHPETTDDNSESYSRGGRCATAQAPPGAGRATSTGS